MAEIGMRWGGLVDRSILIASLCAAGLAHAVAEIVLLAEPRFPYWGIVAPVYACLMAGGWLLLRRADAEGALIGSQYVARFDRVSSMSLIEAAREARRLLADETIFESRPVTAESPPILEGIPESIRSLFENSEQIEKVDDDFVLSRHALTILPDRQLQLGRWKSREGGESSVQVNLATGETSLWFHGEDDDFEAETLPSVYHLIVMQVPDN